MYCIEESTCDTIERPIVIRHPPLLRHALHFLIDV